MNNYKEDIEFLLQNYMSILQQFGPCYVSIHNGECKAYTGLEDEIMHTYAELCDTYGKDNFVFFQISDDKKDIELLAKFYIARYVAGGNI